MKTPIYDTLKELKREKRIPFHMPGHKRRGRDIFRDISEIDITEITGYDNLHHPEGIIRQSMDELKQIYGTRESWYLINGSTVGILAAISACCEPGDGILIGRNCHKSVYNAIQILHLKAYYFYPHLSEQYGCVDSIGEEARKDMEALLREHDTIRAVVLTSPTYEGVVMDVEEIKKIAENYHVPLIVDEAHGAHFPFHEYFPKSAIDCGADIVIQSVHKTLPAMTQTALLHLCTDIILPSVLAEKLAVYESSSPSYVLMASAECAVASMTENVHLLQEYVDNLQNFREKCGQLRQIHLINREDLDCEDYDRSKLVFSVQCEEKAQKERGWDGLAVFRCLSERYHIELEMADRQNCIAMTSVCDDKEMYDALWEALKEIDEAIHQDREKDKEFTEKAGREKAKENRTEERCRIKHRKANQTEKVLESWQCSRRIKKEVPLHEAEGRIAGNYVMLYPPGSPVLVPGEKIVKETVENLRYYIYNGYNVLGLSGDKMIVMEEE